MFNEDTIPLRRGRPIRLPESADAVPGNVRAGRPRSRGAHFLAPSFDFFPVQVI